MAMSKHEQPRGLKATLVANELPGPFVRFRAGSEGPLFHGSARIHELVRSLLKLRLARGLMIGLAVIVMLVTPSAVYTCGPFLESAVFAPGSGPQFSKSDFASGKLGAVLPSFRRAYLIVAYRYLNGLKFDDEQQQDAVDIFSGHVAPDAWVESNDAIAAWRAVRGKVSGIPAVGDFEAFAPVSNKESYYTFLNCPREAFQTAAATLEDRIGRYTAASSAVRDWVTAQDQVFSNCDGRAVVIPAVLDSTDPVLRIDRAYQIAAAQFYAGRFDDAAASFDALAKESSSGWSGISSYLAARALIRKANLSTAEYNKFDMPAMIAAQQRLERVAQDPKAAKVHVAAQRLLDYVRFRTEPDKRITELEQLMLQADPGPGFRQHLWDYILLVSHGQQHGDLSDWLQTFYSDWSGSFSEAYSRPDAKPAAEHAVAKWRDGHSLPWLIAALQLADANGPEVQDLLKAAGQVPVSSPGYLSVRYFAVRLMVNRKQEDAARQELDRLLGSMAADVPPGTRNLFNDQRQRLATSLADFLAHAGEVPSWVGFDYGGIEEDAEGEDEEHKPTPAAGKPYLNAYAAQVLARRLPLRLLAESGQSTTLPPHLRRELARSTWVRAVLAGDFAVAGAVQPVLREFDNPLWKTMEAFRAASSDSEKHFAAVFVMLQNPGLMPSVREGLLRSATLGEIDNYRDNWWCDDLGPGLGDKTRQRQSPEFPVPGFVAESDRSRVKGELEKLAAVGFAPNYLASEVLAFAKQHPDDPRIPQALHLAVRATRYGCTNADTTRLSETAFNLLHGQYPKSEWAEKTKYHY